MIDLFTKQLAPADEVIASAVGDETVILNLKNSAYYGLDAVGTRVWGLLREGHSPVDICIRLADEYEVAPELIEADVRCLLGELHANEIVVVSGRSDGQ